MVVSELCEVIKKQDKEIKAKEEIIQKQNEEIIRLHREIENKNRELSYKWQYDENFGELDYEPVSDELSIEFEEEEGLECVEALPELYDFDDIDDYDTGSFEFCGEYDSFCYKLAGGNAEVAAAIFAGLD